MANSSRTDSKIDYVDRGERIAQRKREREEGPKDLEAEFGWGDPDRERIGSIAAFLKIKADKHRRLVILSTKPLFYLGHFDNGFMAPHFRKACPICESRRAGTQDRLVFHCWDSEIRVDGLLELPGEAGSSGHQLQLMSNDAGYLRSLQFDFYKEGGKRNGKIIAKADGAWPRMADLPTEIDLLSEMKKLWKKHGYDYF